LDDVKTEWRLHHVADRADGQRKRREFERLHHLPNVRVLEGRVPEDWTDGAFDLIVLSELLYYLDLDSRRGVAERSVQTLLPGGDLVAVHWRHPFTEAATTGDVVHTELAEVLHAAGIGPVAVHVEDDFRLEVFQRPG
jgi:SAM-dependent methyltransferase